MTIQRRGYARPQYVKDAVGHVQDVRASFEDFSPLLGGKGQGRTLRSWHSKARVLASDGRLGSLERHC